jgi:hypothetical protein
VDWQSLVKSIDRDTARAFVTAARHIIDALLVEAERVREAREPAGRDYNAAGLPRAGASGSWVSHDELRATARRMAEAIAAEKWTDGVVATLQVLALFGGLT